MLTHQQFAYVIGNSWQLQLLTQEQIEKLDSEHWVFCCNRFLSNWDKIGFRPTVWAYGDTGGGTNVPQSVVNTYFKQELKTIKNDDKLLDRLRHIFICIESQEARDIIMDYDLPIPITFYKRYKWREPNQNLAQNLNDKMFHYGGTLTDLVNLAHILTNNTIKLCGCQYMTRWGHFYPEPSTNENYLPIQQSQMADKLWAGLAMLQNHGVTILDCNIEHGQPIPEKFHIDKSSLF